MVQAPQLQQRLQSFEIRAVVFGLENVLIGRPASEGPRADQRLQALERSTVITPQDPAYPLITHARLNSQTDRRAIAGLLNKRPTEVPAANFLGDYLYRNFSGTEDVRRALTQIREAGVPIAVWDNAFGGTLHTIHAILDRDYGDLIPRSLRLFSPSFRAAVGEDRSVEALLEHLGLGPSDILYVTAHPGNRDFAQCHGMKTCYFRLSGEDLGTSSLSLSLARYLLTNREDGAADNIQDPHIYMTEFRKVFEAAIGKANVMGLTPGMPELEGYKNLANLMLAQQGANRILESNLKAIVIDQLLWEGRGLSGPLAPYLVKIPDLPTLPKFKPLDDFRREAMAMVEGHLRQVESGHPDMARTAVEQLLAELESFFRVDEDFLRSTGIVSDVGRMIRRHIENNHALYVDVTGVFHEEEWQTLVGVFGEDNAQLDARFAEWVNETYNTERKMAAGGTPVEEIRAYVRERLVEDLILRVMELEMRDRSLTSGRPRIELFPNIHDTKNRAAALTEGINDKRFWGAVMAVQTTTMARWIRSLVARMKHMAKRSGVAMSYTYDTDPTQATMELAEMSEPQREALDHVLTELLVNAIKYSTGSQEARVMVHVTEIDREIVIQISDNGVGIRDTEAIWKSGMRERPDLAEGTGGGLPSVLHHVQSQGWVIGVSSTPGEGSTFTLKLGRRPSSSPPAE